MTTAVPHAPGQISDDDVPDPSSLTDALVRITASRNCVSELWHHRGLTPRHTEIKKLVRP